MVNHYYNHTNSCTVVHHPACFETYFVSIESPCQSMMR